MFRSFGCGLGGLSVARIAFSRTLQIHNLAHCSDVGCYRCESNRNATFGPNWEQVPNIVRIAVINGWDRS